MFSSMRNMSLLSSVGFGVDSTVRKILKQIVDAGIIQKQDPQFILPTCTILNLDNAAKHFNAAFLIALKQNSLSYEIYKSQSNEVKDKIRTAIAQQFIANYEQKYNDDLIKYHYRYTVYESIFEDKRSNMRFQESKEFRGISLLNKIMDTDHDMIQKILIEEMDSAIKSCLQYINARELNYNKNNIQITIRKSDELDKPTSCVVKNNML